MKKIFMIAIGIIICSTICMVSYGAFLNYSSENNINLRMANRVLALEGMAVTEREIRPVRNLDSIRLTTELMTDAISRLDGRVAEVYVNQSDDVEKDQPLFRIVNEDIDIKLAQIDANIIKAETELSNAEHSYQRYTRLIDSGAVSLEQYEQVQTKYKGAQQEVKQLQLERQQYEVQKDRLIIKSPIKGRVLMLYKQVGSILQAGSSVALVGDFASLQFTEDVDDDDLVRTIGSANFNDFKDAAWELEFSQHDMDKIFNTDYKEGNKGKQERFVARITKIVPPPAVAASVRTLYWEVANTSAVLEAKRYQDVKIHHPQSIKTLVIPREALVDYNEDRVYVWDSKTQQLALKRITAGMSNNKYVEVLAGLKEGEIVIVSGKDGLKAGLRADVKVLEGESVGR